MCKMDPMFGFDIRFVLIYYSPERVYCSTKDAHTSEITFLALLPCLYGSLHAAPGIPHGLRWLKLG